MSPIYAANYGPKTFFIWPNISGAMPGFNSLSAVGEYSFSVADPGYLARILFSPIPDPGSTNRNKGEG